MKFAMLATYEFATVLTVITAASLGYYAPEIGRWIMHITDLG